MPGVGCNVPGGYGVKVGEANMGRASWQRTGHATGGVRCQIDLPASETSLDMRCNRTSDAFQAACRFVRRHLPSSAAAREGASFTVAAEMRAPGGGCRWRVLCRWQSGESIDKAFQHGRAMWDALP